MNCIAIDNLSFSIEDKGEVDPYWTILGNGEGLCGVEFGQKLLNSELISVATFEYYFVQSLMFEIKTLDIK